MLRGMDASRAYPYALKAGSSANAAGAPSADVRAGMRRPAFSCPPSLCLRAIPAGNQAIESIAPYPELLERKQGLADERKYSRIIASLPCRLSARRLPGKWGIWLKRRAAG